MSDDINFNSLKEKLISENEKLYGQEVRERYGEAVVTESNARVAWMTRVQWQEQETLSQEIGTLLVKAVQTGNPAGAEARDLCEAHRKWLCFFWKEENYSLEAHQQLAEMYVSDARFRSFYEQIVPGGAEFLRDALALYGTTDPQ